MSDARVMTDDVGVTWTVRAILPSGRSALALRREYEGGWLSFTAADGQQRRLGPIPADWETCSDERLRELWAQAAPTRFRYGDPHSGRWSGPSSDKPE